MAAIAIFDLQVTPMLPCKFGVNWPFGSGEEEKNRFSRWRPSWISDWHDFSYFWSTGHPEASYQVSSQLAQGCRKSRLLKQLLTPHDGHWLTTIAHHEHFVLRWANYPTEKAFEISVFSTEALNFTEISVKFQWPLIYNKDFTEIPVEFQWT